MGDLNVQYFQVSDLKPYGKNPRKTDRAVGYVASSIQAFGFKVPIVIDRDNVIVCGHVRYRAAKRLHLDRVPCIVADDLTPEQINAFRIIDNKTQELSTWNFAKLIEELDSLAEEYNLEQFGFNESDGKSSGSKASEFEQDLNDSEEIDIGDFDDEKFTCTCPACGFRFND